MRMKLRTVEGEELYKERMYTAEPVFGQMKQNRGFREFLLKEILKNGIRRVDQFEVGMKKDAIGA
jgi:transposase